MATYIIGNDGMIQNRIVADSAEQANPNNDYDFVQEIDGAVNPAGYGWTYDGNGVYPPVPPSNDNSGS
jgi:hypothetical protein